MYKIFLIFFTIFPVIVFNKKMEVKCPSYCDCDIFEKYRRAVCTNKKLVMLQASIPQQTQILDLSFNLITHLEDHAFFEEKLLSLKLLNMSHNKISQIHMNVFEGLDNLKTLDLSFNALQRLLVNWFWSLKSLKELYLRGNQLGRLSEEPVFESKTLQVLDLSHCAISFIGVDAFTKVPNLQQLDVSDNYLIQLNSMVVSPLKKLTKLLVDKNSFSCNNVMEELGNYCRENNVQYKDPCTDDVERRTTAVEKFQRIVVEETEKEKRNSWIYEDNTDDDNNNNNVTVVQNCTCPTPATTNNKQQGTILTEIIRLSPVMSILVTFIYGILVGLVIGCSVQIKSTSKRRNFNNKWDNSHLRRSLIRANLDNDGQTLMLTEWNPPESTPVVARKFTNL